MKLTKIKGSFLIGAGTLLLVCAFLLWFYTFQPSKFVTPNYVIYSAIVSVVFILAIIAGLIIFISGSLLINKTKTLKILGIMGYK
jgi:uncharacterized membrane protein YidH (DUF202 family)